MEDFYNLGYANLSMQTAPTKCEFSQNLQTIMKASQWTDKWDNT